MLGCAANKALITRMNPVISVFLIALQAVKQYGISSGNYNRESVRDVAQYYLDNKCEFEKIRAELSTCGTEYPVMKLMDMCMWQIAFEEDEG